MFGNVSPFPPLPEEIWQRWTWDPYLMLALGLVVWAYLRGVQKLWQRAGAGRVISRGQVGAFVLGMVALFVAFVSPLNALAAALFSAHMVQHLALILWAAPLLVWSEPLIASLWALPQPVRQRIGRGWNKMAVVKKVWRVLVQPLPVWVFYALVLWVWHLPYLYQAALTQRWVHELEHVMFLGSAMLWWWIILRPAARRQLKQGVNVLFVFTTALHGGTLGALLTFAQVPLYPIYASTATAWGLTLLEDQQLAGLLMWVPPGLIYVATALILFSSWLNALEKKMQQKEAGLYPKI